MVEWGGMLRGQGARWSLRSITGWMGPGFGGRGSRSGDLTDREMTRYGARHLTWLVAAKHVVVSWTDKPHTHTYGRL